MRFAWYTCRTRFAKSGRSEPGPIETPAPQKKTTLPLSSSFKSRTGIAGPPPHLSLAFQKAKRLVQIPDMQRFLLNIIGLDALRVVHMSH